MRFLVLGMIVVLTAGCGGQTRSGGSASSPTHSDPSQSSTQQAGADQPGSTSLTPSVSASETNPPAATDPSRSAAMSEGIDASHHQGPIKWPMVAGSGITFAYLKATEGTTFVDSMFQLNAVNAQASGIKVGGYHYFRACSDPSRQASHFIEALRRTPTDLPPAIDIEHDKCTSQRDQLVTGIKDFIGKVEQATGKQVVLYVYPDVESQHQVRAEFSKNPQWVRSIGKRPVGNWWIWQRSGSGTVAGIAGRVDLNTMRAP